MILLDARVELTLFIVISIVAGIIIFFLLLFPLIKFIAYKHFTMRIYYRHINKVTYDHDFYLVNDFENYTVTEEKFHVDHIMVGDKFIYCIRDRYYNGAVEGKVTDKTWNYYKNSKKVEISNPMMRNKTRVQRLSLLSGTRLDAFVSIVLVNDDCFLSSGLDDGEYSYIVSLKKFPKLIEMIEKRDVEILDPSRTEIFANDLAKINLKGDEK